MDVLLQTMKDKSAEESVDQNIKSEGVAPGDNGLEKGKESEDQEQSIEKASEIKEEEGTSLPPTPSADDVGVGGEEAGSRKRKYQNRNKQNRFEIDCAQVHHHGDNSSPARPFLIFISICLWLCLDRLCIDRDLSWCWNRIWTLRCVEA